MSLLPVIVWSVCFLIPLLVAAFVSGAWTWSDMSERWPWLAVALGCATGASSLLPVASASPSLTLLLASAAGAAVAQAFAQHRAHAALVAAPG